MARTRWSSCRDGRRSDPSRQKRGGGRGGTAVASQQVTIGKDLLGLENLTADQIRLILDTAEPFKEISERQIKKVPTLRGMTIVNLFFEARRARVFPSSSRRSGCRPIR